MKELMAPIDSAGRIVLPKEVREELAIRPGDLLCVATVGGSVTLTPQRAKAGLVRKGRALVFCAPAKELITADEVSKILESGREESLAATGGKRVPSHKA